MPSLREVPIQSVLIGKRNIAVAVHFYAAVSSLLKQVMRTRFPVLSAGYVYFPCVMIGPLICLLLYCDWQSILLFQDYV